MHNKTNASHEKIFILINALLQWSSKCVMKNCFEKFKLKL